MVSEQFGLALVYWDGVFNHEEARWLRWATLDGALLPVTADHRREAAIERQRAEFQRLQTLFERQRADEERQRAADLAGQLDAQRRRIAELEALLADRGGSAE